MKRLFVTYSNELYANTRDFAAKMALIFGGFDKAIVYKPEDIDDSFRETNKKILSQKRGAGLWLWKPYSVYKALMEETEMGDILFYGDAGSFFFRSCKSIINSLSEDDIWVSNLPLIERQYTKEDAFNIMECNRPEFRDSSQVQANFICVRKSDRSIAFVKEWLDWCCRYDLLADDSSTQISPNCSDYIAHRNDQSVLSLLSKRWGLKFHLDPSQYGLYPEKYGTRGINVSTGNEGEYKHSIFLHREKKITFKLLVRALSVSFLPKAVVKKISKVYS